MRRLRTWTLCARKPAGNVIAAITTISQLYSVTPINARLMLDFEGLLKEYKNMDNLLVLHNNHIYNSQNTLIF